jgi:hypothetical protein
MTTKQPTDARAGVVSGRVFLVLTISLIGACAAMGLAWVMIGGH